MFIQSSANSILRSMSTHAKSIATAVALMAISATPLFSAEQSVCGPRPKLIEQLSKKYHEQPIAIGLSKNGTLIEVLTSESGSTWTLMVSQPDGVSCLIAAGEDWEELKRVASGERGA